MIQTSNVTVFVADSRCGERTAGTLDNAGKQHNALAKR
jgi:hypothetical protein